MDVQSPDLGIQNLELSDCGPPMWWGVNDYFCHEAQPQGSSATSEICGFDDYFENFCSQMQKDLENTHSHPGSATCNALGSSPDSSFVPCSVSGGSNPAQPSGSRFGTPLSEVQVSSLSSPFVPAATQKNTRWSVGIFNDWMAHRNSLVLAESERVPVGFLDRPDCVCNASVLNKWLTRFVLEGTRKSSGDPYPPETIYSILCGLYRYMQGKFGVGVPNFLSRRNPQFKDLNGATDRYYRDLRAKGIGVEKKRAQPLSEEDIETLWSSKVIGVDSPQALLNAVFLLNGKNFALRNSEHYSLKVSQLTRVHDPDGYIYNENGSKNRSGGLQDFRIPNKSVPIYACPEFEEHCHVYILDFYLSKLPVEALLNDTFYMRPLPAIPPAAYLPWFTKQRIGKNAIAGLMTKMCKDAGIVGPRTSHSLRVTAATSLYEKQVPEKLIQERTGHRSLGALRIYERTSVHQQEAVSRLLVGSKRSFEDEMSAGGTNKRVKSENVQQPEEQKPACAAKGEKGMFVQNCVVNVYSDGRVGDIGPVQTNTHTCPLPDPDYDAAFAADLPFFDGIAHLIP